MSAKVNNLLKDSVFSAELSDGEHKAVSLPEVLAMLAAGNIEDFPALRAHQQMFWHMFLVQLAAIAMHRNQLTEIPTDPKQWETLLRVLTSAYSQDEPWCLFVDDWNQPAFMQPPVPASIKLKKVLSTPDDLDLLITSRNHDLKQSICGDNTVEDWVFALISLQTGEGYGGAGNQGIARMNGGSSSRSLFGLSPQENHKRQSVLHPSRWFQRDLSVLSSTRDSSHCLDFAKEDGLALVWLSPWPESAQVQTKELDQWFIEICRRVRIEYQADRFIAKQGTSKATRLNAKHLNGSLGDPWQPVHVADNKSFTLGDEGEFNYRKLTELLLSGDWETPLLARPVTADADHLNLIAMALARGNSKTGGYKYRLLPISGKTIKSLGPRQKEVYELAQLLIQSVNAFDKALAESLVLAIADGDKEKKNKEHYKYTKLHRDRLDQFADSIFFPHLWLCVDGKDGSGGFEEHSFQFKTALWKKTQNIFEYALSEIPCSSFYRPRAEAKAHSLFMYRIRKSFPELFTQKTSEETPNDG